MTTDEIIQYYQDLLILQYIGQPRAYATIGALAKMVVMDQLPVQVQNAFCIGDMTIGGVLYPGAVGAQLDVLGKYAGVTRDGYDLRGNPLHLEDEDFTQLIKLAVVRNSSGTSMYDVQRLLHLFFPNQIFIYDGLDMSINYLVTGSVGSRALIELFVTEGIIPKPMGVGLSAIVYVSATSLFGFDTYDTDFTAWGSTTTYVQGQRVFDSGIIYASIQSSNTNHSVSDATWWVALVYPFGTYDTYPTYNSYQWLTYDDTINIL